MRWKMEIKWEDHAFLFYSTSSLSRNLSIWIGLLLFKESFWALCKFENTELGGKKKKKKKPYKAKVTAPAPSFMVSAAWWMPGYSTPDIGHLWTTGSALGLCFPSLTMVQTIFPKSPILFSLFLTFFCFYLNSAFKQDWAPQSHSCS